MTKNMPMADYLAIPALSSSGIKKLLVSAQDFWVSSWMNPDRYEPENEAFKVGTAYHKRLLEGAQAFYAAYAPEFDKEAHPDALVTIPDIKEALEALNAKPLGKVKADFVAQLMGLDPSAKILDVLQDGHKALHDGKEFIPNRVFKQIEAAGARVDKTECFAGGEAEYTAVWHDEKTGVPLKVRFDYLKFGKLKDLKTFSNSGGLDLGYLIASHIQRYKYHVQLAMYEEAHKVIIGTVPELEIAFQQTGPANNFIVKTFPNDLVALQQGRDLMRQGINKFAEMYRKFGANPWYDVFETTPIKDEDFSFYMFE